jgi:predicted transcriptional regulator
MEVSDQPFESFTVRLPRKMMRELQELADRERRSKNGEANVAIRAHLAADKQRRKPWAARSR